MSLIDFEKPAKVAVGGGFDGAYTDGGYEPQMSAADARKWRGKRFNKGKEGDRIEIKKRFDGNGTMVVLVVAKDGWTGKHEVIQRKPTDKWVRETKGLNFRMSMNGPILLTWEDYQEFHAVVEEAWALLNESTV